MPAAVSADDEHAPLMAQFEQLPRLVDDDADLVRRGAWVDLQFQVGLGAVPYHLTVAGGRITGLDRGPILMRPSRFQISATTEAWRRFWQPLPEPGWHDLLALTKRGAAASRATCSRCLPTCNTSRTCWRRRVAWQARRADTGQAGAHRRPLHDARTRRARAPRLFRGGGAGIPLVCLHTAGADGRQFRHLMLDEAITSHYRVLAFDMPWHGKSLPPEGWQREEYRLTTAAYTEMVVAFCEALELQRPVVMGCSIGGRIVLNLAIEHAARFRALIGLEAADFQQPWYDTAWLNRPDVHGGEVCAALVSGLIAPQSPDVSRHETLWMYKQGGPGVFKGDLYFYRVDGDLRSKVGAIDTKVCPLYLLTGEYDFSCTPEDTLRTADPLPAPR